MKGEWNMRTILGIALSFSVSSYALAACNSDDEGNSGLPPDGGSGSPTVVTDKGAVVGSESGGVRSFLGIPYAAPPVHSLRWKAPADVSWTEPRMATTFGPRCFGTALLDATHVNSDASEDCLSLNIWSPVGGASAKPVFVWIHGGGNVDGTSSTYPGAALAQLGDIVVVTLNYRLSTLGFLGLPFADGGGNLGLLDQAFALRWIQRNIAAFGGDPTKVTLAGQSAGGQSVAFHGAMASSQGLFRAMLLESAPVEGSQSNAQAVATATTLAQQWGCANSGDAGPVIDQACLQGLPADTLVKGVASLSVGAIVDGTLVTASPRAAIKAGTFAKVPLLAGFNATEGYFFTDGIAGAPPLVTASDYSNYLNAAFGPSFGPAVESRYPLSQYGNDPRLAMQTVFADSGYECPTRHLVTSVSTPAFLYKFAYAPPLNSPKPVGAMHTVELPFLWDTPLPWTWWTQTNPGVPASASELDLASILKSHWIRFVQTGDPSTAQKAWTAWAPSTQNAMIFSESGSDVAFSANANCAFWDQVYGQ